MSETSALIETLKRILKSKKITYASIAQELNISEASVKRTFSEGSFTLERFGKICALADLTITEVATLTKSSHDDDRYQYTIEQEEFFAENPKYLAFFDMLIRLGSVRKIVAVRPHFTDRKIATYMKQLDKMGLIERLDGEKFRFRVSRHVVWITNGPLRKKFLPLAKNDFVQHPFSDANSSFEFSSVQLSAGSIEKIVAKLKELATEIRYVADLEKKINVDTSDYGFMICMRPWKFDLLEDC